MTREELLLYMEEKRRLNRVLPVMHCQGCRAFFKSRWPTCPSCQSGYVVPADPYRSAQMEHFFIE